MMRRLIPKRIYSILAFLVIIIACVFFISFTQTGARWTITIAEKVIPGKLAVSGIHGKLAGPLTIDKFSYKIDNTTISGEQIELEWKPDDLLLSKLIINKLTANNIVINIANNKNSKSTNFNVFNFIANLQSLSLPLALQLQNIQLKNVTITSKNLPQSAVINNFALQLNTTHTYVDYIDMELDSPHAMITVKGKLHKQYDINWNVNITNLGSLIKGSKGTIVSQGQISGTKTNPIIKSSTKIDHLILEHAKVNKLQSDMHINLSADQVSQINFAASNLALDGYKVDQINLKTQIKTTQQQQRVISINAQLQQTNLSLPSDYDKHIIPIQNAKLTAIIDDTGLNAKLQVAPAAQATIYADLTISRSKKLQGSVKWNTNDVSFFSKIFPIVQQIKGHAAVDIQLFGTVAKPQYNATLTVQNGTAKLPKLGLNITNIQFNAKGNNKKMDYTLTLNSGGKLKLTGSTQMDKSHLPCDLILTGTDLLISNTPTIQIYASPDIKGTLDTNGLKAEGTITIPRATFKPYDFSSTATLPSDIVYVDKHQQKLFIKKKNFNVYLNVDLILGNKININTMGLSGRLTGKINVQEQPKGTTATGALYLKDGIYNVYGQPLTISNGSLVYSDSPIDDPLLDITAVRKFKAAGSTSSITNGDSLTVGAHIQGTLDNPTTTLFSSPITLTNEDIMSYLILGQPSSQLGQNSDKLNLLFRAAQALSFGGSGSVVTSITNSISNKLGLSELGLESETNLAGDDGTTVTSSALVVGRYLGPDVYLSYSYGIFDQFSTVKLRYKIWKELYIQTEGGASTSGTNKVGGDLLYSFGTR